MKKPAPVALIVEGNSSNSIVLRLPILTAELGPVKSTTLRVARRLSNFLHAGYAVASYDELQNTRLVLIRVPDAAVPRVVSELCASELNLHSLSFVLCESWLAADVLYPLRMLGASTATLLPVPSTRRRWFIMEGQGPATRQTRRLLQSSQARTIELRAGRKELYFAAEILATVLPIPLLAAGQKALRDAGITGNNLHDLLDDLVQKMSKNALHASRKPWGGPLTACSPETISSYCEALRRTDPSLAQFLHEHLEYAKKNLPAKIKQL